MQDDTATDVFEPTVRGVAQSGVRLANERAVLALIAGIPGVSNADIARRSGLGPQTTARILLDLETRGMVVRGEVLRGRRGQPATPYRLNPDAGFSLGVEIGWSHIEVLLQNIAGTPLAVVRRNIDFADPDMVFGQVAAEVGTLLAGLTPWQRERLAGIGVATPGAFGPLLERLGATPAQIEAWAGIDIAARMAAATHLPSLWVNDGSAAAWYEITALQAPRPAGVAGIFIGTFVSGGIVTGGSLMEGPYGHAADIGGMLVCDPSGRPRHVHLIASIHALRQALETFGLVPPAGGPRQWDWAQFEPQAAIWIEQAGAALAQAIVSASALSEIDIVALNGDLPRPVLERLLDATRRSIESLPVLVRRIPSVVLSDAGPSAVALGAAGLVLYRRHFSRAWHIFDAETDK